MAALGRALVRYPDEVIIHVTSPETGIQRRSKWPPSFSDVIDACDQYAAELEKKRRFENWGAQAAGAIEDKRSRASVAELKGRFGDRWGIQQEHEVAKPPPEPIDREKVFAHYKTHGLGFKRKEQL